MEGMLQEMQGNTKGTGREVIVKLILQWISTSEQTTAALVLICPVLGTTEDSSILESREWKVSIRLFFLQLILVYAFCAASQGGAM